MTNWPADKVERRAVDRLVPYAGNARTHSADQVAQIAASLQEWGWTNPVLLDETGMIIAGHARVLAAKRLGIVGLEIDASYCDVVVKRWQDFTGKAATLEGDGRTFAEIDAERFDTTARDDNSAKSYDVALEAKRKKHRAVA